MAKLDSKGAGMSSYKIAVIFPSRGMAYSQTCEELLENLEGYNYEIFFSHRLPIPECFNKPLEEALRGSYTHFWFVEEDMILPKDTLKTMLGEIKDAVTCDYPVSRAGKASVLRDPRGDAVYGGTGCLLVTRKFLKSLKPPIFRTDIAWDVKIGDRLEATPRKVDNNLYGLHDATFGLQAYSKGLVTKVSKVQCGQRKLINLGAQATNIGQHNIQLWTQLTPEVLKLPKLKQRNVLLNDGTLVFMHVKRAKQLEKEGKVTIPKEEYVELMGKI